MNGIGSAREMMKQASLRLGTARRQAKSGSKAYAVRSAQECAEFSLKAALRSVGVDYPKKHDMSNILLEVKSRMPSWFEVDVIVEESKWLAERRESAMYGYELSDKGPESLFSRKDAVTAVNYSAHIFKACKRLVGISK